MAMIDISSFGGLAPILSARKLPEHGAQRALDCLFAGTDLRPLRESVQQAALGFTAGRLFKYRFQGAGTWLAWPNTHVVDVVASPIPKDTLGRLYWSRMNPANTGDTVDGYPRVASQPTQNAIINNASSIRRLGIPAPPGAPSVTETQVASSIRPVTMSQTSPITVTTATTHPFENGQRVVVKFSTVANPDADGNTPNMGALNGQEFVIGASAAQQFELRGSRGDGLPAMTDPSVITIERVYGDADMVTRSYVYTGVSDWGEEGLPSAPTDPFDIRYDSTMAVTVKTTFPAPFNGYINRVRLYRTESGQNGAQFFFVKEAAIASPGADITITDDVQPVALGELLPSLTWEMPPNHLQGLVAMPNGFLVGFVGNTLYCSEAYQPHAWPDEYRKTTEDDIVGLAVFGQTLVVATKGKPYLASGSDPLSLTLAQLDAHAPCIAKSSVCSVGFGVVFATYDGLALVAGGVPSIVTDGYADKVQWANLWAVNTATAFHDGRLIALSTTAGKSLALRVTANRLDIANLSITGGAPALDPDDDSLHYAAGSARMRFDTGAPRTAEWTSRVFGLPRAGNFSVGQVYADAYPVTITVGYSNLAPNTGQPSSIISDSFTVTVAGPEPFRLPSGFLSREYEVRVRTTTSVQRVVLAEFTDELR